MVKPKNIPAIIGRIIDQWVPGVAFSVMFLSFGIQIFSRYVLNKPLFWADELLMIAYVWAVLFSASYAYRHGEHVCFTLVYDKRSDLGKCIFRLAGNLLIIVPFALSIAPTLDYIHFLRRDITPVFRWPMAIYYWPMVFVFLLIAIRLTYEMAKDIRLLAALINHKEGNT